MSGTIGLIIAGFAAYWVFSDAKSRGNSATYCGFWALGTFFFLIICLPLYLLLGRKSPKREESADRRDPAVIDVEAHVVEDPDMTCPMCAKPVREDYIVCPFCGNTLKPHCENCGCELARECTECPGCNHPAPRK